MNKLAKLDNLVDNSDVAHEKIERRLMVLAFIVGMALNVLSIWIGNPYIVTGIVIIFCGAATLLRGKYQRPWIFFATILAANPVNVNTPVACNLLFAALLILVGLKFLRRLPRWIYIVNIIAFVGIALSSINWPAGAEGVILKEQIGAVINYLAGPFFLLPLIFSGLEGEKDGRGNFQGLLYFIIIPSTVMLFLAYQFGTPVITSGDVSHVITNLTTLKLWNTLFYLIRTQSGFIIASLICAAIAALIFQVGTLNRLLAAACLSFNVYLLMVSGSIGSTVAGICGVMVMLFASVFRINIFKYILMITLAAGILFTVWTVSDSGIKKYVTNRYEQRFTKKGVDAKDRIFIWKRAVSFIAEHPEGIGWTQIYIDEIKTYPHNDYFTYTIAYSILGGGIYLYVILRIGGSLIRRPRGRDESPYDLAVRMAGLGVAVVLAINSNSDHLTANRWYYNVIWSLLWFAYFCNRPSGSDPGHAPTQLIIEK